MIQPFPGAAVLLAAVLALGCVTMGPGEPTRSHDEVGILVAPPPQVRDGQAVVGCAAGLIEGTLVADTESGVALLSAGTLSPIVWPTGYGARRVGAEVQVLDSDGRVVSTTGEAVRIGGGAIDGGGVRWWACDGGISPVATQ
jgi:hypothetical protein